MLWFLVAVIGLALIFCVFGLVASVQHTKKVKKLQANADYNFKTTNGSYKFQYMIKSFNDGNGKKIVVAITPILGFSDLKTAKTNSFHIVNAIIQNNRSKENYESKALIYEEGMKPLDVNYTINIPYTFLDSEGKIDANITIESSWNLGGKDIVEELKFDFKK